MAQSGNKASGRGLGTRLHSCLYTDISPKALLMNKLLPPPPTHTHLKQPSTSSVSHGEVPRVVVESSKSLSSGSSQKLGEGMRREREFVGKGEYKEEEEGGGGWTVERRL